MSLTLISRIPIPFRWLIFLGYLIAIVYASLASPREIPKIMTIPNIDKVVHFTMYLGFCIIGLWALNTGEGSLSKRLPGKRNYFLITVMAIAWGLFMEFMQRYMGIGRQYSIYDLYANIAGAIIGSLLFFIIVRTNKTTN